MRRSRRRSASTSRAWAVRGSRRRFVRRIPSATATRCSARRPATWRPIRRSSGRWWPMWSRTRSGGASGWRRASAACPDWPAIDVGAAWLSLRVTTMAREDVAARLAGLAVEAEACRNCALGSVRTQAVFGVGNPEADLMFVGEAPGFHEDKQGEPFVGAAGQLLTKLIEQKLGLKRA